MMLVIGSAASGKREYLLSLGFAQGDIADGVMDASPAVINVQAMVARDPASAEKLLLPLCEKEAVAVDETGSGVIPYERGEREAREATGRLTVLLARRADRVVRMVAGIPQVIKG